MEKNYPEKLLKKYLRGECTEQEKAILESWHLESLKEHPQPVDEAELQIAAKRLSERVKFPVQRKLVISQWYKIAATMALLVSAAYLFFNSGTENYAVKTMQNKTSGIVPGENKAVLYLADGSKIELDNSKDGMIAKQGSAAINKGSSGFITYSTSKTSQAASAGLINTIYVPLGGTYQLVLEDGSKVWVNSGSSMKFPVVFNAKQRIIELVGEAYFEIAKDKGRPFIVKTNHQEILVTGTHFNVSAYPDDQLTTTTLLEGEVHVSNGTAKKVLKPGQQSLLSSRSSYITVQIPDDLESITGWKNGYFMSSHENIKSIMTKVARWYNVEVEYKGDFSHKYFTGTISKQEELADVLKIIGLTNSVIFKVEGRRILVMR